MESSAGTNAAALVHFAWGDVSMIDGEARATDAAQDLWAFCEGSVAGRGKTRWLGISPPAVRPGQPAGRRARPMPTRASSDELAPSRARDRRRHACVTARAHGGGPPGRHPPAIEVVPSSCVGRPLPVGLRWTWIPTRAPYVQYR